MNLGQLVLGIAGKVDARIGFRFAVDLPCVKEQEGSDLVVTDDDVLDLLYSMFRSIISSRDAMKCVLAIGVVSLTTISRVVCDVAHQWNSPLPDRTQEPAYGAWQTAEAKTELAKVVSLTVQTLVMKAARPSPQGPPRESVIMDLPQGAVVDSYGSA